MANRSGPTLEIDSPAAFDAAVLAGATSMRGWRVQDVDLRERTSQLLGLDPGGSVLFGCEVDPVAEEHLRRGGALLFPDLPDLPFDPYRARLYTPAELYPDIATAPYERATDALVYGWTLRPDDDITRRLASALHDHAIDRALEDELVSVHAVGVMGDHSTLRSEDGYLDAARLGHRLATAGRRVTTGGGPGSMEAANLGAYLSRYDESALPEAVGLLAGAPAFRPSVTAWARAAFEVRERWPDGARSVGIPTWYYGHEPPNAFASAIAKYFQNSRDRSVLRR